MAPRKKAAPAVDAEVKTEAAAVEVAAENTAAKKTTKSSAKTTSKTTKAAAAKKTTATRTRKAAAKAEPAAEAPAAPVAEAAAPKTEIFIEYGGVQVSVDEIISNAKKIVGDDKDIKIYIQPDTSKAYIAFNGESVSMDVFFCK